MSADKKCKCGHSEASHSVNGWRGDEYCTGTNGLSPRFSDCSCREFVQDPPPTKKEER